MNIRFARAAKVSLKVYFDLEFRSVSMCGVQTSGVGPRTYNKSFCRVLGSGWSTSGSISRTKGRRKTGSELVNARTELRRPAPASWNYAMTISYTSKIGRFYRLLDSLPG